MSRRVVALTFVTLGLDWTMWQAYDDGMTNTQEPHGFVVVDGLTDDVDYFDEYGDAVHFLNNIATDHARDGYTIEHGWASTDNLSAVKVTNSDGRSYYLSVEKDQS